MTTVDFKAEVEKRRDEMMADLYSLLEINSERLMTARQMQSILLDLVL